MMYVRCYYGSDIYYETQRKGFASGTGTDQGHRISMAVIACFALANRPDYARRFFPRELGLVTRSHVTLNRVGSLIVGLLYDDDVWRKKCCRMLASICRKTPDKRECCCKLFGRTVWMATPPVWVKTCNWLADNYRKATWLVMGDACRLSLYGFYLMAKLFLPENLFSRYSVPRGQAGGMNMFIRLQNSASFLLTRHISPSRSH